MRIRDSIALPSGWLSLAPPGRGASWRCRSARSWDAGARIHTSTVLRRPQRRWETSLLGAQPQLFAAHRLAMYVFADAADGRAAGARLRRAPAVEIAVILMAISAALSALPKKLSCSAPTHRMSTAWRAHGAARDCHCTASRSRAELLHRPSSVPPAGCRRDHDGFLAPLLAGMVCATCGRRWPSVLRAAHRRVRILLLCWCCSWLRQRPAIVGIGLPSFALIVAVTCAALAIGHVLGGPDPSDRTTLALASATRFRPSGCSSRR